MTLTVLPGALGGAAHSQQLFAGVSPSGGPARAVPLLRQFASGRVRRRPRDPLE